DVRLGLHPGPVGVGDVGGEARQEQLALGETANLAARLQGIAAPNTLVISATTFQLLGGFFACQPLGTPLLKGLAQPLAVYRVLYESMARSRLEAVGSTGWTPLVGREQEIWLLLERWAQVKDGFGQVVLLSGEAGIGKPKPDSPCWTRRWKQWINMGSVSTKRSCIGSKGSYCWPSPSKTTS